MLWTKVMACFWQCANNHQVKESSGIRQTPRECSPFSSQPQVWQWRWLTQPDLPQVIWRTFVGLSVAQHRKGNLGGIHFQFTRQQKHFCSASAPPLANSRYSHACVTLCMVKTSVELELKGQVYVSHKSVKPTKASLRHWQVQFLYWYEARNPVMCEWRAWRRVQLRCEQIHRAASLP